jgi:hypothetical protein
MANIWTPDQEAPAMAQWVKMIGAVESCAVEMEYLLKKYGMEIFAINLDIFYNNTPEKIILQVERYRYLNSILQQQGSGNKATKAFTPPVDPTKENG